MSQTEMCPCLRKGTLKSGFLENISNSKKSPVDNGAQLGRHNYNGDLPYRPKKQGDGTEALGVCGPWCKVRTHQAGIVSKLSRMAN